MRAALALICVGSFAIAGAQTTDRFPDSPENHWAFQALSRLKKDGILVGYPDGLYRGARPATRFELAAAVHAAYLNIKASTDAINTQIDTLKQKMDQGGVTKADMDALKAAIQDLTNSKPDYSKDLADLRKLMSEFQPELAALGANIETIKKDLGGLDERVGVLEKRKLPVDIRGTVDSVGMGGFSRDNTFGISVDGRPTGVGRGDNANQPTNLFRDLSLFHEFAVSLTDNMHEDPNFRLTVAAGNMLDDFERPQDTGLGDQSVPVANNPFHEGNETVYLQNASYKFEGKKGRIPFRIEMGRFDHQISSYTYQRPDATPYFTNDRWDNGRWTTDGLIARIGLGAKTLNFFVAKPSIMTPVAGKNSVGVQQMFAGQAGAPFGVGAFRPIGQMTGMMPINTVIGADLRAPFLKNGQLVATYLNLDSDSGGSAPVLAPGLTKAAIPQLFFGTPNVNRVEVLGVSFHALVGGILPLHGSFAQTNLKFDDHPVISHDNQAFELGITKDNKGLGFKAGFRSIGPNFGAPGDWGRLGMWWNPTDVNDFFITPTLPLGSSWEVQVETHYATGQGKGGFANFATDFRSVVIPMSSSDHQANVSVHLNHKLSGNTKLLMGVEDASWHFKGRTDNSLGFPVDVPGGNPKERWYNLGLNMLKGSSNFSVLFQLSDYDAHGVAWFGLPNPGAAFFGQTNPRAKGGLITTQMSSKF